WRVVLYEFETEVILGHEGQGVRQLPQQVRPRPEGGVADRDDKAKAAAPVAAQRCHCRPASRYHLLRSEHVRRELDQLRHDGRDVGGQSASDVMQMQIDVLALPVQM